MHGIGPQLRAAREAREISLELAEEETKIRKKYLQALEDDTPEVIPGDVYARGFLRTYANWLGLDGAQLLEQYKELHSGAPVSQPPVQTQAPSVVQSVAPAPVSVPKQQGAPATMVPKRKERHKPGLSGMPILVACGIVAVAFAGYLLVRSMGHQSASPPPPAAAGETSSGAGSNPNGTTAGNGTGVTNSPAAGTGTTAPQGTGAGSGTAAGTGTTPGTTATGTPASTEQQAAKVTMNKPKGEAVLFDVNGTGPIDVTLQFESKQAVYMKVTVDGKVVAEQTTTDPSKTHWTGKTITIRLGHAETLKAIQVNGQTFEKPLKGGPFTLTFTPHT